MENINGVVKEDGGLRAAFCRAPGLAAHTLSALALAVAHNLRLQITDPLANNTTDADDVDDAATDDGTADRSTLPASGCWRQRQHQHRH